jgi:hypothetical protein
MDAEELNAELHAGFNSTAKVRERRPGRIYQIDLPAYLADGDPANIFVKPDERGWLLTDLGHTCQRISYSRELTKSAMSSLRKLAERYRFGFDGGQIYAHFKPSELFPYAMRLAQLQAEAEAVLPPTAPREVTAEQFAEIVRDALKAVFADLVIFDYRDRERDPEGLYTVDAYIRGPSIAAVEIIPGDAEAEHAVSTKFRLSEPRSGAGLESPRRWVALTKDLARLRPGSRTRLENEFDVPFTATPRDAARLQQELRPLLLS